MGQVTLNFDDSMKIINNPDASPDARMIAAAFIAFHEANGSAVDADSSTRAIVLKLNHMTAAAVYDAEGG
ncbi:MAG: hypothetical protein ACREP4_06525 [Stenotrophomonas sp.]|uniref:hypothetical protein n=1 Tax=Stenotrophomonas sp. TaxID=69392 RepID=UPI003D6CBEFF